MSASGSHPPRSVSILLPSELAVHVLHSRLTSTRQIVSFLLNLRLLRETCELEYQGGNEGKDRVEAQEAAGVHLHPLA